jgi:UDP:flavonoid glycosyltransferase YjiC (YdhE family)
MRFLFCTRPFYGHLHPMAPVARALQIHGHDVVVATAREFRPAVESAGFPFLPAGMDPRAPLPPAIAAVADESRDWGEYVTRAKTNDLVAAAKCWRPDVIVREQTDFSGLLAGEALGLPCATLGPALFIPPESWRRLMGSTLDRIRRSYGLAPDPGMERLHPYLYLDVAPPWYQLPEASVLRVLHPIRPTVFPTADDQPPLPWLGRLQARPIVYVTLGTVFNQRPDLFAAILLGLADADINVVATTGTDQEPAEVCDDPPANARLERWIDQSRLLPHCAAVIAHGGFSTVMGALSHGLPMLLIPLGADNPVHARLCCALGVARSLSSAEASPSVVRNLADDVLADRGLREQARRCGRQLARLPGPEAAVALLVRLAADQRPIAQNWRRGGRGLPDVGSQPTSSA